jgi:YegS/Rv2252/BmrU family lipid kinase
METPAGEERRETRIILNPAAHNFPPRPVLARIDEWLRAQGWYVGWRETAAPGHGIELAAQAAAEGLPLVFALGGDGTLNEVANGLAGSETALAPIPAGTSNLWAREIGLGKDPLRAVQTLLYGPRRRIDLGLVRDPFGGAARYFMLMASFGIDAAVAQNVSLGLKGRIGAAAYAVSSAREVLRYRGTRARIWLDDHNFEADLLMLIAGNTRNYAGITQITPEAVVDDGLLDICAYVGRGRLHILAHAVRTLLQTHRRAGTVVYRRVRRLRIECERPLPLQLDGDPVEGAFEEVVAVPGALWVAVPPGVTSPLFSQPAPGSPPG